MDTKKVNRLKKILMLEEKVSKWFTHKFLRRQALVQICAGDKLPKESGDDPYLFFVSIGWLHKEAQDDPGLMQILVENEL